MAIPFRVQDLYNFLHAPGVFKSLQSKHVEESSVSLLIYLIRYEDIAVHVFQAVSRLPYI